MLGNPTLFHHAKSIEKKYSEEINIDITGAGEAF